MREDFFTPKQQEFLERATHRWNVKEGATRSGKTYLDYYVIPRRIRRLRDKAGLVVLLGNTKGTLQRNIITPLQGIWGTGLVSDIKSDNTAVLFGERCYCLGADKVSQVDVLRGCSIKYAYGDEVVTWAKDVFEMLKSRMDKPYSCFDGTCNPDAPSHWFKEFLDNPGGLDLYRQNYRLEDNPFLDPSVAENLRREYAGSVFFDRYILGRWALAEGLIYQGFGEKNRYRGEIPHRRQEESVRFISCDYGTVNPCVFLDLLVDRQGVVRMDNAYYYNSRDKQNGGRLKTDEEYYQDLRQLVFSRMIRYIQGQESGERILEPECIIVDPSAASFIECIRRHGEFPVLPADNNVPDGIRRTGVLINTGRLQVQEERCAPVIREFQSYAWNSKVADQDKPIKEYDHAMDALRYFVNTIYGRRWPL